VTFLPTLKIRFSTFKLHLINM